MKIEEFIETCNKSPLFRKKFNGGITKAFLEDFEFIKDEYNLRVDLAELNKKLTDFITPIEPAELSEVYRGKKWSKQLLHEDLIKRVYNQKLIMQCRKELDMPFENKGFNLANTSKARSYPSLAGHFTNTNFEFIEPAFKEWFFSLAEKINYYDEYEKWEKTCNVVSEKLNKVISNVLKKWKLPKRYKNAIGELILFNRIIPSGSGISWKTIRESDGSMTETIAYEDGISKTELIKHISHFYRKKKLKKEFGAPRKSKETEKIIALYNSLRSRKTDNWKTTDKEIFEEMHKYYYPKLSVRAIQKRIKGY